MLEKYGVEHILKLEIYKQKIKKYNKINKHCVSKYIYNNIFFDSSWQLAFYLYHIDHNINIERDVKSFTYYDRNKKQRIYHPDFYLPDTNQFIQIKGKLYYLNMSEQLKQCISNNNIKLLFYNDMKIYLTYLKDNYKDYKKYQVKNGENNKNE